jgi:hypothetical protein
VFAAKDFTGIPECDMGIACAAERDEREEPFPQKAGRDA